MFTAQAHSFVQQARLAITLAWVAGYTNVVTLIVLGTATSHVSGTGSKLGEHAIEGRWHLTLIMLWLLATFALGALISGLATEHARRRGRESIYVLPMGVEAALLALLALALDLAPTESLSITASGSWFFLASAIASMAMGLQNATITHISHGVVRTTHVTGVVTDIGLETARLFFDASAKDHPPLVHQPTTRRIALLASILGSFVLGAGLGTLAHEHINKAVMAPPVLFLLWIIVQDVLRPIAEIESSTLHDASSGLDLPASLAVYHLRAERGSRLPDLSLWAERLSPAMRVVLLDLQGLGELDQDAVHELGALAGLLAAQERSLVIAGLKPHQFQQLLQGLPKGTLDPLDLCPDLELGLARAFNHLDEPSLS